MTEYILGSTQAKVEQAFIEDTASMKDSINPKHYTEHPSGVECIKITEHMNFCLGNAIKYIWRAGLKTGTSKEEDLQKALWYIKREIKRLNYAR